MAAGRWSRRRWQGSTARSRRRTRRSSRPGNRQLAGVTELLDGVPEFLDRGEPDRPSADVRDECLDPLVIAGPAQPVQDVGQDHPTPGQHRRDRIGGPLLAQPVGKVQLQDQRRGPALPQLGDLVGNHRLRHGHSLCGPTAAAVGYLRPGWHLATVTGGRRAATATGTGACTVPLACLPIPLAALAGPACCCSAGANGVTTAAPGGCLAARWTATSP